MSIFQGYVVLRKVTRTFHHHLPPNLVVYLGVNATSIDSPYTCLSVEASYMPFYIFAGSGLGCRL